MAARESDIVRLLETAGPDLYAVLVRLTLREDVAEELMQELFIKLHKSDGYASASDPAAYAWRAAVHLALNWRRARKRRDRVTSLAQEPAAAERSPLARLVEAEQLERDEAVVDQRFAQSQAPSSTDPQKKTGILAVLSIQYAHARPMPGEYCHTHRHGK